MSLEDDFMAGAEGGNAKVKLTRTTISIPEKILFALEDQVTHNKRNKLPLRSVSALIKDSLERTM